MKRDSAIWYSAKRDSAKRDSAKRDSVKRDSAKRDSAKRDSAKRDSGETGFGETGRNHRLDVGKFKFASRVCEEWIRLGDGIVSAETVNVFKTRLDHHLRNVRGYL